MRHLVLRSTLFFLLLGLTIGAATAPPAAAARTSRDILLEDLTVGSTEDDIYHRAERPGAVVRLVPWLDEDGGFRILAVTELGWVYQSGDDPSEWTLIGRIFDDADLD